MDAWARNRSFPLGESKDFTPPQEFPAGDGLALDAHPLLPFSRREKEQNA